tara:strand:+ start:349 stop:627 length:279 start_codon:yes stop_codon:yes gene_type:complete
MTLRDTELIGNKLVKYGFSRSLTDHQYYNTLGTIGSISIRFKKFGTIWRAIIIHTMDVNFEVRYTFYGEVFTPEWVIEESKKFQAMFKFLRG